MDHVRWEAYTQFKHAPSHYFVACEALNKALSAPLNGHFDERHAKQMYERKRNETYPRSTPVHFACIALRSVTMVMRRNATHEKRTPERGTDFSFPRPACLRRIPNSAHTNRNDEHSISKTCSFLPAIPTRISAFRRLTVSAFWQTRRSGYRGWAQCRRRKLRKFPNGAGAMRRPRLSRESLKRLMTGSGRRAPEDCPLAPRWP